MKKVINVVGAVIVRDGLILCAKRSEHGTLPNLWEFPGGKIEPDESPREALEREIREELRSEILIGDEITTTRYEYNFGIVALTTFYCELLSEAPELMEHAEVRWLSPKELHTLEWAPADIPTVKSIQADFESR